jgi:sulfide:quinone oxidoreductase
MKNLTIVGAGTGGTMVANRMRKRLPAGWQVTVIDPSPVHLYQPGLLFLPFGAKDETAIQRPRRCTLGRGVTWIAEGVQRIDTERREVRLGGGDRVGYDLLVLATGARIRPDLTPGWDEGRARGEVHDFYTLEGAQALRSALPRFTGGRLVVNCVEMPIKCPVAPLELLFLADAYFRRRGIRERVELVYVTPLDACFTRPLAAKMFNHLLVEKGIRVETDFATGEIDAAGRVLRSYDEREIPYDLLVSVPTHSGAQVIEDSGLGNELAFVPTDKNTLAVKGHEDIFALGDATDLPTSKAGSVAHFQAEVLEENLTRVLGGREPEPAFDGHANCFIETGGGKAMLIDFNYDIEPLPGRFPSPRFGPLSLMKETRRNHLGKRAFRWVYWHGLLPGKPIPVPNQVPADRVRRAEALLSEGRLLTAPPP